MELTIKIKNESYKIKQSLRGLMIFEEMTGKYVSDINESLNDTIKLFYSLLKGTNKDFKYEYDELIDIIDENPTILDEFNNYLVNLANQNKPQPTKKKVVQKQK